MKSLFSIVLLLTLFSLKAQESKPATVLTAPENWRPEIINFPLSFAPSLDYTGFEDIRFSPGWADTTATDYFTYTFTWVLDQNPKLNQEKLETQMKAYFDGLMAVVSERDDLPKTKASFSFSKARKDFGASGRVTFYEAFFKQEVISLNVALAGKRCPKTDQYLVRFELSPKPLTDPLWKTFAEVKMKIDCEK